MSLDELRRLRKLLFGTHGAAGPADVFMCLRDRSLQGDVRALALANEVRRLQALANPERFMGNPPAQDLARELLDRLGELHRAAVGSLADGPEPPAVTAEPAAPGPVEEPPHGWTVGGDLRPAPRPDPPPTIEVTVAGNRYVLDGEALVGDLATVRRGHIGEAGDRLEVAAKLAQSSADNSFILAEIAALRLLQTGDAAQRGQLPRVLDLFHGPGGEAGVILPWIGGYDAVTLRQRFPEGVPPEHVIWIGRRLLSVVGHAHRLGVLHANIEPAHILVRPHDHHVSLIDWCWSVVEPARTRQGFRVYNPDYSAPEVAEKKPPIPAADLYSIGRCMLYLIGGDMADGSMPEAVPDRLQRLIKYLMRPSPLQRAQDAWEMFRELERVREAVYGEHRFQEFVVP
jgi:hypothetical protein